MEEDSTILNIICGSIFFLIIIIILIISRMLLKSVILFIFKPPNPKEQIVVFNTGLQTIITLLATLFTIPILWISISGIFEVISLKGTIYVYIGILAVLGILACVLGLAYAYKYLFYAIQLDRYGVTKKVKLDKLFTVESNTPNGGTFDYVPYSLDHQIKGTARVYKMREKNAYFQDRLELMVTYLDNMPAVRRLTFRILNQPLLFKQEKSEPITVAARPLIKEALKKFVSFPTGTFIIFTHKPTQNFVQFLMMDDEFLLEYAIGPKQESSEYTERAYRFFFDHHISSVNEDDNTIAYQMSFQITETAEAAQIVMDIFTQVYLLPATSIIEYEIGS